MNGFSQDAFFQRRLNGIEQNQIYVGYSENAFQVESRKSRIPEIPDTHFSFKIKYGTGFWTLIILLLNMGVQDLQDLGF
jgi:hypothetical protein